MSIDLISEKITSTILKYHQRPMKSVKLTQQINYLHMEDKEGTFGLMVLNTSNPKIAEIHSQEDFTYWYNEFNAPFV